MTHTVQIFKGAQLQLTAWVFFLDTQSLELNAWKYLWNNRSTFLQGSMEPSVYRTTVSNDEMRHKQYIMPRHRGRLNIMMSFYQYMNSHYKDKTVSRQPHFIMKITIPRRTVFVLRRGIGVAAANSSEWWSLQHRFSIHRFCWVYESCDAQVLYPYFAKRCSHWPINSLTIYKWELVWQIQWSSFLAC